MFDLSTGHWERAGDLTRARASGKMVVVGGERARVILMGGCDALGESLITVDVFDSYSRSWKLAPYDMMDGRSGHDVVEVPYNMF